MVVTETSSSSSLPPIGLGLAALGRPGYINLNRNEIFGDGDRSIKTMQNQANDVMDTLFSMKKNNRPWLDCARSYGLSEKFVGEYLRSKGDTIKPKDVYVSSKWGYTYVADWNVKLEPGAKHEVKDHSVENFLKQVEETNEYIGEFVNLYQVHSATFDSGILTNKDVHEALSKCRKDRGWAIGLSVSGPDQNQLIREAMKIKDTITTTRPLFDSVQCTYNILEQRPYDALMEAHDAGMDIIIKEGLANGRIFQNDNVIKHAKEFRCEPDQLALGCILAQPFEPRVLSGAATSAHLVSNYKALDISERLKKEPSVLKEIMKDCLQESEQYWTDRTNLEWN